MHVPLFAIFMKKKVIFMVTTKLQFGLEVKACLMESREVHGLVCPTYAVALPVPVRNLVVLIGSQTVHGHGEPARPLRHSQTALCNP